MERGVLIEAGILGVVRRPFLHDLSFLILFFLLNVEGIHLALGESLSLVVIALISRSYEADDIFGQNDNSDSAVFLMIACSDTDVIVNGIEKGFSAFSADETIVN